MYFKLTDEKKKSEDTRKKRKGAKNGGTSWLAEASNGAMRLAEERNMACGRLISEWKKPAIHARILWREIPYYTNFPQ